MKRFLRFSDGVGSDEFSLYSGHHQARSLKNKDKNELIGGSRKEDRKMAACNFLIAMTIKFVRFFFPFEALSRQNT